MSLRSFKPDWEDALLGFLIIFLFALSVASDSIEGTISTACFAAIIYSVNCYEDEP